MDTNKWITQIDKTTELFKNEFEKLSDEELNWKASKNSWSIAQNIEHLIIINETYFPIIKALKDGSYKISFLHKIGFLVNMMGNIILKAVQPDRKKRIKTFNIWEPTKSKISSDILERFIKHQLNLKTHIENSSELLLKKTVISSPVNKKIVYKLETDFDIIVSHELRHFEQTKEILTLQKKN